MVKPEPVVTMLVDGRITEAECPLCHDPLPLENDVGSPKEQAMKLEGAFGRHMNKHHRKEDASQAAARSVREATEKD